MGYIERVNAPKCHAVDSRDHPVASPRALGVLPDANHRRFDDLGRGLHFENAEPALAAVTALLDALKVRDQATGAHRAGQRLPG
jgi:hypothetical protein